MSSSNYSAQPQKNTFNELGLHPKLLNIIHQSGYTQPTQIQSQAIPAILEGQDVMGAAQTGTGKTAAFTLPVLHRLLPLANKSMSPAKHPVRALMLTPTRELADQVAEDVKRYSKDTDLRAEVVYGGVDINPQKQALLKGCEILIATPGRLLDHLEQKTVNLSQVAILVLDEADRMLDMGFMPDLERIINTLPNNRQNLLFSATFNTEIRKLGRSLLKDPTEITVASKNTTADTVKQTIYHVNETSKKAALLYLLKSQCLEQVIVFANTKLEVSKINSFLNRESIRSESIHGGKSQRDRSMVLDDFKDKKVQVLVATDVAARGLDVSGLPFVINFDLPYNPEDYVHRIGRTGRAGTKGEAITLYTEADTKNLEGIAKLISKKIKPIHLSIPDVFVKRSGRKGKLGKAFAAEQTAPIDSFFFRPYIPESSTPKKLPTLKQVLKQHHEQELERRGEEMLAVLLGGRPGQTSDNTSKS